MASTIDVRQLARRTGSGPPGRIAPRRAWLSRCVLPAALVLGFAGVFAWAARDLFRPTRDVTVLPVVVRHGTSETAGTPLFSAAGWVEARPSPVLVPALAEGIVDRILVVENQAVEADQPVATLIEADARLAFTQAEAEQSVRQAEVESARAASVAARSTLENPVAREAALAEAEAALAAVQRESASLEFDIRAAEAHKRFAEQELHRKQTAGQAVAGRDLQRSQSEVESAAAAVAALEAKRAPLAAQADALGRQSAALRKQLQQKTDETRELAQAEAREKVAEAMLRQAEAAVAAARLRLERMTVRAPMCGRVLDVVAMPGTRVAGALGGSQHESSTVVTLYDPAQLQVRADVRLEDLPRVVAGQPVRIETAAVGRPLAGKVLYATSAADIQKNTLEVKVSIDDPPALVKPEMLVQVTFLAPANAQSPKAAAPVMRLFVPNQLIEREEDKAYVWVADQTAGVARRREVRLGAASDGELAEVASGLSMSDRLIVSGREGLADGGAIRVTGDDATFGIGQQGD